MEISIYMKKTKYKNIGTKVIVTDENGNDKIVYPQYFLYKSKDKNNKFNTENFIKLSKEIFGDNTYDYTKTICHNSADKVTITCKIHGDFIKSAIENKINIKYFTLTKFLNEKYFDKLYDNIEELLLN